MLLLNCSGICPRNPSGKWIQLVLPFWTPGLGPGVAWGADGGCKADLGLSTLTVCSWLPARSKSLVMGEQNRSPGRPLAPHKLGPVLKAGWLKKQRSIMKNWQQRWFVLRGDQLFYYKDKDESKPQVRHEGLRPIGVVPGQRGGAWGLSFECECKQGQYSSLTYPCACSQITACFSKAHSQLLR